MKITITCEEEGWKSSVSVEADGLDGWECAIKAAMTAAGYEPETIAELFKGDLWTLCLETEQN